MSGSCKHDNETLGSIRVVELLEHLSDYQLRKTIPLLEIRYFTCLILCVPSLQKELFNFVLPMQRLACQGTGFSVSVTAKSRHLCERKSLVFRRERSAI